MFVGKNSLPYAQHDFINHRINFYFNIEPMQRDATEKVYRFMLERVPRSPLNNPRRTKTKGRAQEGDALSEILSGRFKSPTTCQKHAIRLRTPC